MLCRRKGHSRSSIGPELSTCNRQLTLGSTLANAHAVRDDISASECTFSRGARIVSDASNRLAHSGSPANGVVSMIGMTRWHVLLHFVGTDAAWGSPTLHLVFLAPVLINRKRLAKQVRYETRLETATNRAGNMYRKVVGRPTAA